MREDWFVEIFTGYIQSCKNILTSTVGLIYSKESLYGVYKEQMTRGKDVDQILQEMTMLLEMQHAFAKY